MNEFQIVASNLSGCLDPAIAIAASRAGSIGLLNLELIDDIPTARAALAKLVHLGGSPLAAKLDTAVPAVTEQLLTELPPEVALVVFTAVTSERLAEYVGQVRQLGRHVWLEVTTTEQAQLGQQLGVDGLIAKGNEAGGAVGDETTYILLQRLLHTGMLPVWAYGGIGLHTAAACYAAGAAGVVLDIQLALTRESPLPSAVKQMIATMDGSETSCVGAELDQLFRLYTRPGGVPVAKWHALAQSIVQDAESQAAGAHKWRTALQAQLGWDSRNDHIWPLGQDVAFAAGLGQRFHTVSGVLGAFKAAVHEHLRLAQTLRPLDAGAPFAQSHGLRYPIVQGPMTRVSDKAEFALRVAEGGGLPFLALALMRAPEVEALLVETKRLLGSHAWGVGILGFVPADLRQEQMEVVRKYRPPVAMIAGGRPDQAQVLEQDGVPTYLHVPSPGLLRLFLQDGARRFIFEGRECGGHVGPRSSFVLWNTMVDVLLAEVPAADARDCHVLFAGGIHDAQAAAMVAALAAPLAERGMRIGVLMGTAYIFTEEAVTTGAIVAGFQAEALRCQVTKLVESGPGHAIRIVPTPYLDLFAQEKQRLLAEGHPHETVREALEDLNVGRLRIASKGINRHPQYRKDPNAPKFIEVSDAEQHAGGMYMIGQVAAMHDQVVTIEELHRTVAIGGTELLAAQADDTAAMDDGQPRQQPCDVAIIGMGCLLPQAPDLQSYWENILNKVNAVTEVPPERWDVTQYYDADRTARDKVYSKWGGFLRDTPFDPMRYGIPPNTLRSIEPIQLLTLDVVRAALEDAGYADRVFPRERTSVILGAGGGIGDLGQQYTARAMLPEVLADIPPELLGQFPEWTEDSFPGILLNVISGRVSNRFDLGGVNYTVDAACASSLAAVYQGVRELEMGTSDMVITGGVDNVQNSFAFLAFSKTHALSPRGRCRTFDDSADGIAISEGLAIVVLKRLADAERDGDRIYAVIKGIAGSSDGRDRSLTAPRPIGQARAVERAFAKAGFSPATVGLVEAHGTGTVVGDQAEVETLKLVFGPAGAERQSCAIGSVKSMIGHTKAAAGVAGLVKVALSLSHKVLPATLGVEKPNGKIGFEESPFYINSENRPWLNDNAAHPRRASVSAFGFGGTNFHAVVEEYTRAFTAPEATTQNRASELCLWSTPSRPALIAALEALEAAFAGGAEPRLSDLAYTLAKAWNRHDPTKHLCLAIVATSIEDLRRKIATARTSLQGTATHINDPKGIYFTEQPLARDGKIAFLFPGQGSQYTNMLGDLAMTFPEVRETFEASDAVLADRLPQPLSRYIFPQPAFTPEAEHDQQQALTQTNVAQAALGVTSMALFDLLATLGVAPEMVAGHSYGEYAALWAAGAMDRQALISLSEARGRAIIDAAQDDLGTMAAVSAPPEAITEVIAGLEGVWMANLNAPQQTMISGTRAGITAAVERLQEHGLSARSIPVACAFHSPLVAPAQQLLASALASVEFRAPVIEVFSNTLAAPYPHEPAAISELLAEHLVRPVRFTEEIEALYAAGARLFVEVGPRNVVSGLTRHTLDKRPHLALAVDAPNQPGITQLQQALAQLAAQGVPVQMERLFQGRALRQLDLLQLVAQTAPKPLSATTWFVNGGRARPKSEPNGPAHHPVKLATPSTPAQPQPVGAGPAAPPTLAPPMTNGHGPASQGAGGKANGLAQGTTPQSLPAIQPVAASGHAPKTTTNGHLPPAAGSNGGASVQPATNGHTTNGYAQAYIEHVPHTDRPTPVVSQGTGQVMVQFQHMMDRYLDTQRNVMLSYLHGAPAGGVALMPLVTPSVPPVVIEPSRAEPTAERAAAPLPTPPRPAPVVEQTVVVEAAAPVVAPRATPSHAAVPPAVPATTPVVTVAAPAPAPKLTRETVTAHLLGIVSERTGYPPEMLDLDQDLEADLGIDSIKRVEVLGRLRQVLAAGGNEQGRDLDRLSKLKTLRQIIDQSVDAPRANGSAHGKVVLAPEAAPRMDGAAVVQRPIHRFTLQAVERPLGATTGMLAAGSVVLLTDDGTGLAHALAAQLQHAGHPTKILQISNHSECDWRSPEAVEQLIGRVRQTDGAIGALLHLAPLRPPATYEQLDLAAWRAELDAEVRTLFLLAKALRDELAGAAKAGGAALVALTGMGGTFGSVLGPQAPTFFPGQGAISGFLKSLAREWPEVRIKAVDVDPQESIERLAQHVLTEATASDGLVEIGYSMGRRVSLEPMNSPLQQGSTLSLAHDSVVLITGGAQGITADVALELAEQYRPILVLAGRSPLPPAREAAETVGLTTPSALKAALIERSRAQGKPVSPVAIEKEYGRLLKEREMRRNLQALTAAGAQVHYHAVDVRDEQALGNLINETYRTFGRIDGVVHGAGIIEDKLVADKQVESFDRVFGTKVESAWTLSKWLQPESLRFLVFFSSVAGRFGNRGQSDYAAANEVLNKLAVYLDRTWPTHVVALNWGPWAKLGMVGPELQREFDRRGVAMVPPEEGRQRFHDEIRWGNKGESEVIVGGDQL